MADPLVTIVMPTYNRPDYLRQAIDSALNQTYQDFMLVVVDNASPDNTADVVRSYQDSRISYHRHDSNIGPQRNWRFALTYPKTRYVALLEDDNLYHPWHLESAITALESETQAGFYGCTTESFGAKNSEIYKPWWLIHDKGIIFNRARERYISCLRGTPVVSSSLVARRDALDKIEIWGGTTWPANMDYLWQGQMMLCGGFLFNTVSGIQYRWHESNYITSWKAKARYAASEYRWTVRTLANIGFRRGIFSPQQLISEVLAWPGTEASTLITALTAPETDEPLRKAAMLMFYAHRDVRGPRASGHTRLAGRIGSWYLRYADRFDRIRSHWPPKE